MPPRYRKKPENTSRTALWVGAGVAVAVVCLVACVGLFFALKGGKTGPNDGTDNNPAPGFSLPARAVLDPDSVDNTRAWTADAVKRLKDTEAQKNDAATKREVARVEKEFRDALLGKRVRWTFPVEAVDEGELKLDTFFGTDAGRYSGDVPDYKGRPMRRLYFRVYFDGDADMVRVGDEVTAAEADRLKKGGKFTVSRTVTEVSVHVHDNWISSSAYSKVVDVLEPYCVTVIVSRKK